MSTMLFCIDEGFFYLWTGGDETELIEIVYDFVIVLSVKG